MSWGITFNTDIFLSHQNYTSLYLVQDKIKDLDEQMERMEKRLALLGATTPRDVVPEESKDDIIEWVVGEVHQILAEYNDTLIERFKLSQYLDYLDGDETKLIKGE
jgi:hypothetical protein